MEKKEYIKQWAEKLSLTVEEIEGEFNTILEEEKKIHSDLPADQQELRALKRIALLYKKQMRSPAVGFEGVIIATSNVVDTTAKQRREAIELYKTDPQLAISQGVTDENGIPLVTKQEWASGKPNPNFGKPLPEHNYMRNVWGVAKKLKDNQPKLFQMVVSGSIANQEIPTFRPVRFSAIDRSEQGDSVSFYKLNVSSYTKFVVDEKIQLPKLEEILKSYISITTIKELGLYHTTNKDNYNRIVAVEGDVSMLNLQSTSAGSRVMVIEDASLFGDLDAKGITCWVPERVKLDFAEGSKVIVWGRTGQGKKKDEQGNVTEELGDVTINVFGCYAIPEYKIALPEEIKPLTEENLDLE